MFGLNLASLLNPKYWLYLILAGLCVWGGKQGYDWIHDRGMSQQAALDTKQISTLTKERNDAVTQYTSYKGEYDTWVRDTKTAKQEFDSEQADRLKSTEVKLTEALAQAKSKQIVIKEVIRYVPAEVDATYKLPLGFMRLYNQSLEGKARTDAIFGDLSRSYPYDAGVSSTITMSQFATLASQNNAECVVRGEIIQAWQTWYVGAKTSYEKAQKIQFDSAPAEK